MRVRDKASNWEEDAHHIAPFKTEMANYLWKFNTIARPIRLSTETLILFSGGRNPPDTLDGTYSRQNQAFLKKDRKTFLKKDEANPIAVPAVRETRGGV